MSTPQCSDHIIQIEDDYVSMSKYTKYDPDKRGKVLIWLNFVLFLLAAAICVASFTDPSFRKAAPNGVVMWQWSLLIMVLLCGPLLSKILHYMVTLIDTKYGAEMTRDNVIYVIVELIESAWKLLWFSLILLAWLRVVEKPDHLGLPEDYEKIKKKFANTFSTVTITLITLIIGAFLWLLKDALFLIAKSSFHINNFFDRVNDALMHQHVINKITYSPNSNDNGKSKLCQVFGCKCDWTEKMPSFDQVNQKNVSSWAMQKVINWFFKNQHLTYKINGEDKKIESEKDAIRAAQEIFPKVAHQNEAIMNEIKPYIKDTEAQPKDQVLEVMHRMVEEQGIIKVEDLKELMVKAFKYRETLAYALKANKKLFRALSRFTDVLLIFIIFAVWLIMLRVETRKVIIFIGTAIVGSAVIVGDTFKKLLDSLLFVFVVHPFDIGDCCLIDNKVVTIKKIKIFTTMVSTFDDEIRYYPNTELAAKFISNYTRSRNMGDFVEFYPNTGVFAEKIEREIESYITKNPRKWGKEYHWVRELSDGGKMKMRLHFKHTISSHDITERQKRKSDLVLQITKILEEIRKEKNA